MTPVQKPEQLAVRRRLILLVSCSTLISAAAQVLMKIGMTHVTHLGLLALATNVPLVAGYALYGLFCLMMILSLRQGELSVVYPIISLAYIWVTVCSYFLFHDTVNLFKVTGIACVIIGVAVLGRQGAES